jgi:hypothetical protein
MESDDTYFLSTPGIEIKNNRSNKDYASVDDIQYSGCCLNNTYPKKEYLTYDQDDAYWKKGDEFNRFYVSGGDDQFFDAQMIEFYGIN